MEPEDLLNYANDQEITSRIGKEKIFYSDKIEKYKFGFFSHFQKRNLLITDIAIYSFENNVIKRRIKIEDIYGITYSKLSQQFVVHFNENEYDYLYKSENRDKIILLLQNLYSKLKNQDILFSIKNEKDLYNYVVRKKERKNNPYAFKLDKNELTSIRDFLDGVAELNSDQDYNQNNEEENNDENNKHEPEPEEIKPPEKPKVTPPPPKPVVKPPPKPVKKPPTDKNFFSINWSIETLPLVPNIVLYGI